MADYFGGVKVEVNVNSWNLYIKEFLIHKNFGDIVLWLGSCDIVSIMLCLLKQWDGNNI